MDGEGDDKKKIMIWELYLCVRLAFHVCVFAGAFQCTFPRKKNVFPCTRKCVCGTTEFAWSSLGSFIVFTSSRLCACVLHRWGQCAHRKVTHWAAFPAQVKYPQAEMRSWKWWQMNALEGLSARGNVHMESQPKDAGSGHWHWHWQSFFILGKPSRLWGICAESKPWQELWTNCKVMDACE